MTQAAAVVDARALLDMRDDGQRYELVEGVLRMMSPAGGRHGRVAHALALILGTHVRNRQLGVVYAAETGFLLARDPDTVRAPDVAFVGRERAVGIDDDHGFVAVIPDLVGEVVSPRDSFSDVEEKVLAWLAAGTRLVIVIDPRTRTLHAYRRPDRVVVLREGESLDAGDVVPGLLIGVADLFQG
jgi:Uma2 family endonuclease